MIDQANRIVHQTKTAVKSVTAGKRACFCPPSDGNTLVKPPISLDAPVAMAGRPAALPAECDVLVVGGGINGAGIARDLAGRGLRVVLCEKDDLGAHTSSASTKLIHGGLRYLEYYEFGMVRKSLAERELLMRSAPHIMRPMRFVMPHNPTMRPAWMIRAGLFLYDHLAKREVLPGSCSMDLRGNEIGAPLKKNFTRGFVYSDGWVDDARLVVLNAIDAASHGATVLTRWICTDARREAKAWQVTLKRSDGVAHTLRARALINAAGPWAAQFLAEHTHLPQRKALRLVKGSHIVVRKLFDHDHAYIFQNPDKRIIFGIPFQDAFTLIGTTDVEYRGDIGNVQIDSTEVAYLCEQASRYFEKPIVPADVVWSYSGVRPLLEDGSGNAAAVTRDYFLELDTEQAPMLTVWGGKLTAFRKLAEEVADMVVGPLACQQGAWTARALLPGGDLSALIGPPQRPDTDFERFADALALRHSKLPAATLRRLARGYGSRIDMILGRGELGAEVAPGLFEAELHYLRQHEWACTADDVLWRRTKLGLHYGVGDRTAVQDWCQQHWAPVPAGAAAVSEAAWS